MQGAGCANGLSARGCAQGRKAYGVHVKPERLGAWPLKERQPRDEHASWYWLQEDYMVERQRTAAWRATFWRTATIAGYAYGVPLSVVLVVGVHAAVMRERVAGARPRSPARPQCSAAP